MTLAKSDEVPMDDLLPLGPTKSKILEYLLFDRKTASDVASHLHVQVSAVRKHLDRLRELGIVEEGFVRAGRGRPKKMYSLSAAGRELLPRRYDTILNAVLDDLIRERGAAGAESAMNRVAADLADRLMQRPKASGGGLERFVAGLTDLGFQASLQARNGVSVITSRNCPILRVASAHRDVACRGLHGELIRIGAQAPNVQRERWIVEGSPFCTHVFQSGREGLPSGTRRRRRYTKGGSAGA